MTKTLHMLVGLPGVGKSTFINKLIMEVIPIGNSLSIISSDAIIESIAKIHGTTYSEIWENSAKLATQLMYKELKQAIVSNSSIIWDQTNLTVKTRKEKLSKIPQDYHKIAWYLPAPPLEEWNRRLKNRSDKFIPENVLNDMQKKLQIPSKEEGFDEIYFIIDDQIFSELTGANDNNS